MNDWYTFYSLATGRILYRHLGKNVNQVSMEELFTGVDFTVVGCILGRFKTQDCYVNLADNQAKNKTTAPISTNKLTITANGIDEVVITLPDCMCQHRSTIIDVTGGQLIFTTDEVGEHKLLFKNMLKYLDQEVVINAI